MPFRLPFNYPSFFNPYRYPNNSNNYFKKKSSQTSYIPPSQAPANTFNNNIGNSNNENNYSFNSTSNNSEKSSTISNSHMKKTSESIDNSVDEDSEAFFEIFGLKLFFDDILIICILFFLYTERVQDEELFICLILLLLS